MATNAVATVTKNLPAFLKGVDVSKSLAMTKAVASLATGGYPVMSIKGKTFSVVRNGDSTMLTKVDQDGDTVPASSIDVVIVAAAQNFSKVFYASGYTEGSKDKPTCHSEDGQAPAPDAADKQAKKCAACKHNAFGSGANGKGKACSDTLRIAIAAPDALNDPLLLRVPPASLKHIAAYATDCTKRGAPLGACLTRLRFDPEEATPRLLFKFRDYVTAEQFAEVEAQAESDLVRNIIGGSIIEAVETEGDDDNTPAVAAKPTKGANKVTLSDDDDEDEAPVKPAKKVTAKPAAEDDDDEPVAAKPAKRAARVVTADTAGKADSLAAKARALLDDDDDDDDA